MNWQGGKEMRGIKGEAKTPREEETRQSDRGNAKGR